MNSQLEAAIKLGRSINASMWCAIGKHHACKGRRIDERYEFHPCECSCHEDSDGDD